MARNNFYNHINFQREGPDDRARKNGWRSAVGENIVITFDLDSGFEKFIRGGRDTSNLLSSIWDVVGIGFYLGGNRLFITVMFSKQPSVTPPPEPPTEPPVEPPT